MRTSSTTAAAHLIDRPRLRARVFGAGEAAAGGSRWAAPLVLLNAPGGYGKSTLAAQLREHARAAGAPADGLRVRTVRCAAPDRPTDGFWCRVRRHLDDDSVSAGRDETVAREWVFAHVGGLTAPVLLVLENYERVSEEETDLALLELCAIGRHLRLLVIARGVRVLDDPRYADRVLTIGTAELAFTEAETQEVAVRCGVEIGPGAPRIPGVDESLGLAAGWPLATVTVLQAEAQEGEHADPLAHTELLATFGAHIESAAFTAAEEVLACGFTAIIDQGSASLSLIRQVPDEALFAYPTLAAARLYLEFVDATVPPQRLWRTSELMYTGAKRRLKVDTDPRRELLIAHRMLEMVGERLRGNAPAALAIALDIETRLLAGGSVSAHGDSDTNRVRHGGPEAQPVLLEEIGFTAFMAGDSALARRAWQRLEALMRSKPGGQPAGGGLPGYGGVSPAHGDEVSRATSRHADWQLAALGGLSLVESNEGDFSLGARLLARADRLREESGAQAPALAWVNGEIARAHHAYQHCDEGKLHEAVSRISPWNDRIEQWPMVIMAQSEHLRWVRGVDWAIPFLRAGITQVENERHGVGVWGGYLALYQVMLNTTLGNFDVSRRMIAALPADNSYVQIEQARLALFSGDNVRALLGIQRLGPAGINLRQQMDRLLIATVAAWGCGSVDEAFASLRDACELVERCDLSMMLRTVPFEPLAEVAAAAREAGACDFTALIDSVPEPARCIARASLTGMERRALETMVSHPALAEAAVELDIAQATVKRHRLAVYRKLRVSGREEAIVQATRMGLLPAPAPRARVAPGPSSADSIGERRRIPGG